MTLVSTDTTNLESDNLESEVSDFLDNYQDVISESIQMIDNHDFKNQLTEFLSSLEMFIKGEHTTPPLDGSSLLNKTYDILRAQDKKSPKDLYGRRISGVTGMQNLLLLKEASEVFSARIEKKEGYFSTLPVSF